jgi:adenine phosphoribosyltransferase
MNGNFYTLHLAGLSRRLPIVPVSEGLSIASFVMLGDTRLIEASAEGLQARLCGTAADYLVCPEAKSIPLCHALARRMGLDYVVIRKSRKSYMERPLTVRVRSITTGVDQMLVLNGPDRDRLVDKQVILVDDVVSTGGSLAAMEDLLAEVPCTVVQRAAALLEEGGYNSDLVYLERLPVFR